MSADFQPGMEPPGNRPLLYNVRQSSALHERERQMDEHQMCSSEIASSPLETRVVAFVDVLGFRALMEEVQADDPARLQTVREVLEWIDKQRDFLSLLEEPKTSTDPPVEISQFSDSLVVSGPGIAAAT